MEIERINPPAMPDSESIGYSQISIVEPGRIAYVSGQVAIRSNNAQIPTELHDQMKIVSENVKEAVKAVGATVKDIVLARVYVVDLDSEKLELIMPVFLSTFEGEKPCVTGVGVQALASPEFLVEMEVVIRVPN